LLAAKIFLTLRKTLKSAVWEHINSFEASDGIIDGNRVIFPYLSRLQNEPKNI
jgi:hypothetical protein